MTDTTHPSTMSAARYHGAGDIRLEEVPVPTPADGQALVRVLRSGICGTDASEWKSGPRIFPVKRAHAVTGHHGPIIPGHEFVGEIVTAPDGSPFAVGDVVASGAGVSCGRCDRCREGRTNLCRRYWTLGLSADGGLAEYVAVPLSTLERVPAGLDVDHAGLAQPLAVGLHAARRAGVRDGDRVVVIGAGAIGTFTLAGLVSLVAAEVTVVDLPGPKLDRARRLGAHEVRPADELDLIEPGADVVIEASGAPGQLNRALSLVRDGGRILQVGLPTQAQEVDVHQAVMREIAITTTLAHVCGEDLGAALEILQTTSLGEELLDSVHALDAVPAQLDRLATGKVDGKVLFDPTVR